MLFQNDDDDDDDEDEATSFALHPADQKIISYHWCINKARASHLKNLWKNGAEIMIIKPKKSKGSILSSHNFAPGLASHLIAAAAILFPDWPGSIFYNSKNCHP